MPGTFSSLCRRIFRNADKTVSLCFGQVDKTSQRDVMFADTTRDYK